tara:strand:+ start:629 stop:1294 length:666 start_codon:yes stop_codon:yes gene_type:complete
MPDIYGTNDGYIWTNTTGGWDAAMDASSGTLVSNGASTTAYYVRIVVFSYGGSTRWIISRSFMEFDTSGISTPPSAATLKIYGSTQTNADAIIVKGTQSDSLESADYDNLDRSVPYSDEVATWNSSAYNDFTLNADARQAMSDNDSFKIAIISYDYDYSDTDPGSPYKSYQLGGHYSESDADKRPYIDYTDGALPDPVVFNEFKIKNSNVNIKKSNLKINR